MSSVNWLAIRSSHNGASPAVFGDGKLFTYEQLSELARGYAAVLHGKGIGAGSHVAVVAHNSLKYVVLIHALILSRAVIVPISTRLTSEEMIRNITYADCTHVLVEDGIQLPVSQPKPSVLNFSDIIPTKGNRMQPVSEGSVEDTLVLMFTSGTTGEPKCVELTYRNFLFSAIGTKLRLNITEHDRWLLSLPVYHIGGFSIVIRSLLYGSSVIVPDSLETENVAQAVLRYDPMLISFVPTLMRRMVEFGIRPNPSQKAILIGGGPVDEALIAEWTQLGWRIAPTYGSTETCSQVATLHPEDKNGQGSAGMALPCTKIEIRDERGFPVGFGSEGEIVVRSPAVMRGYYKQEALTRRVLRDGWYHTGDYGVIERKERYLRVIARRSDLIISGGENVNPLEVEIALRSHRGVRDVCVFPLPDQEWGQVVAAAIVGDKAITPSAIKEFLQGKIAAYKIPKKVFFIDELPYDPDGKLRRDSVRRTFQRH